MRILHIFNSVAGGATGGAIELLRSSRLNHTGIDHFVVYPGMFEEPNPTIAQWCDACQAIPMRAWNQAPSIGLIRRLFYFAVDWRATRWGRRTAAILEDLIHRWKIDLVATNCAANIDGALAARAAGLPHLWQIRERIGSDGSLQFAVDDRRLVERIASLADGILAVSCFAAEPFRRHGASEKTFVVYDGVDHHAFLGSGVEDRSRQLRQIWGIPDNSLLVAKVANVTAAVKKHDLFIKAARVVAEQNPEVYFAIIGALPKKQHWLYRQDIERLQLLRRQIREAGLQDRFVWTDWVADNGAVMQALDILAHACDIEGFPRVALEAMAATRPAVGPAAGGFAETIEDGVSGILVEPGSPEALAKGIATLIDNRPLRRQMGEQGRRRVQANFTIGQHLQTMTNFYSQAVQEHQQSSTLAVP